MYDTPPDVERSIWRPDPPLLTGSHQALFANHDVYHHEEVATCHRGNIYCDVVVCGGILTVVVASSCSCNTYKSTLFCYHHGPKVPPICVEKTH